MGKAERALCREQGKADCYLSEGLILSSPELPANGGFWLAFRSKSNRKAARKQKIDTRW
jgi:hypothetical protein